MFHKTTVFQNMFQNGSMIGFSLVVVMLKPNFLANQTKQAELTQRVRYVVSIFYDQNVFRENIVGVPELEHIMF